MNFAFSVFGLALLLGTLSIAIAFIVNIFDHNFMGSAVQWFKATSPERDSSAVLIAAGSISVVAWTGALIAFQLRSTSIQLWGAFSLLEYAFIAPLFGVLFTGGSLRLIATLAMLVFFAFILRQVLLSFIIRWTMKKTADGDPDREFLATAFGRRIFEALAGIVIFPIGYASACSVASFLIVLLPTEHTVAVTSVGALCFGLNYVLLALKNDRTPPTPEQRATANRAFSGMISIFQRRANELTKGAPVGCKAAPESEAHLTSSKTAGAIQADESLVQNKAEKLARIVELKEVATFLEPLSGQQLRPGLLTKEQYDKARAVLDYFMSNAMNDQDAFNTALGLSQLLAAVAPDGPDKAP